MRFRAEVMADMIGGSEVGALIADINAANTAPAEPQRPRPLTGPTYNVDTRKGQGTRPEDSMRMPKSRR